MIPQTPHARVPVAVARNAGLSPQARCLVLILASYAGPAGSCWPSRRRLAADLGLSIRTVATLLNELERSGLLRRQSRRGTSTIFHLQFPDPAFNHPTGTATPCTGADEPGLTCAAERTTLAPSEPMQSRVADQLGNGLPQSRAADCTGSVENAQTRATDCTGPNSSRPQGCAADCTGSGSPLHGDVQPASHRTTPLNYSPELLPDTEAEPVLSQARDPSPPEPGLPIPDPWATRLEFDPTARWPAYEQVWDYARRSGVPEPDALSIWESYTATGWTDRHGNPIRHWGAALMSAWRYRQENRSRQSRATSSSQYPFTHASHGSYGQHRTQGRETDAATTGLDAQRQDPRITEALALLKQRWQQRQAEHHASH